MAAAPATPRQPRERPAVPGQCGKRARHLRAIGRQNHGVELVGALLAGEGPYLEALGREGQRWRYGYDLGKETGLKSGSLYPILIRLADRGLLETIRERVRGGIPYAGSSAGSVIAAPTMMTTNDMPIVQPASFASLGLIPFHVNCHYFDFDPDSTHKGETREERIREFHEENATPVVGLREGSALHVVDDAVTLLGTIPARIFLRGRQPFEVEAGSRIDEALGKTEVLSPEY